MRPGRGQRALLSLQRGSSGLQQPKPHNSTVWIAMVSPSYSWLFTSRATNTTRSKSQLQSTDVSRHDPRQHISQPLQNAQNLLHNSPKVHSRKSIKSTYLIRISIRFSTGYVRISTGHIRVRVLLGPHTYEIRTEYVRNTYRIRICNNTGLGVRNLV